MRLNDRTKRILRNVLYYATLAILAMPWERHTRLLGHELAVRMVLIAMVAAGYVLSGRGTCWGVVRG